MFKTYSDKINQMSYRQRALMYLGLLMISWFVLMDWFPQCQIIGALFVIFFGYNTLTNINAMNVMEQLVKAEEKTEFIHEGKCYSTKKSKVLFRVDHRYFYDRISEVEEYRRYSVLYKSEKGTYFLYIMERNFNIQIETLSETQAKNWLINENTAGYKEVFGEIEEA